MKKSLLSIASVAIALTISTNTSASNGKIATFDNNAFKTVLGEDHQWKSGKFVKPAHTKVEANGLTLGPADGYSFVQGPDDTQWYAIQTFEESNYYYTASTIKLYNSKGEEQGTINISIPDGQKVNQILVGEAVTPALFDRDKNSYEIPVVVHQILNAGVTSNTTYVYDVASGELKYTYNGFMSLVDYNTGYSTEWVGVVSNDTVVNDTASVKYDIYNKATWSSNGAALKKTFIVPKSLAEYQVGGAFNAFEVDNNMYYVVSAYEKPFLDPASYEEPWDMIPTADNNFVATIYNKNFVEVGKVTIPVTSTSKYLVQYGIGLFGFEDLSNDYWDESGALRLVVATTGFDVTSESEAISFDVYDLESNKVKSIAGNVSNWMKMYNVPRQSDQMAFLNTDGVTLSMVDVPSCETAVTFGSEVDGEAISTNIDRYPVGDSYQYVIGLPSPETDSENNYYHRFAWITKEAKINRIVKFNLGQSNASWVPLVMGEALNPYLFDTDDQHEYVFIANQYASGTSGTMHDELRIMKEDGTELKSYKEDGTNGDLGTCDILGLNSDNPSLIIPFLNSSTDQITLQVDFLPFAMFSKGGDGSAENPYLISSAGDMAMIARDPAANYKVVNDFSAAGYGMWNPIASFTGTLDGGNFTIRDLTLAGNNFEAAIFAATENATIKDLKFENVNLEVSTATSAGIVVGEANTTTISNVHINNATITATADASATIGVIASGASLETKISECSATNLTIDAPGCSTVGGIIGASRTSSTITACAVSGTISADNTIGGIAGSASTGCSVINCHVDADIVGKNTIGGVVGSADRGGIHLCYVEGSLTATEGNWSGNYSVGFIPGSLSTDWVATGEDNPEDAWNGKVISNNVIALSEIKSEAGAAHRVVGYTRWDEDIEASQWDPSIVPMAEPCLDKNYVVSSLAVIDNTVEAAANTTEGANVEASALNKQYFTDLGFAFGTSVDAPWAEKEGNGAVLYFETSATNSVESIINNMVEINYNGSVINAGEAVEIEVYNINGAKVASGASTIDASNLQKGIYVVVATDATGAKKTAKIAVK
mgnify:CR=1 FL=1